MRVSMNWLNDYINVKDIDFKYLAERMTLIGNEVDSIEYLCSATNLVIGYVVSKEPHPNADKLNICLVDIGEKEPKQIVCGAKNVDKGQKVIVATVGAKLPGDFTIKAVTIRGVESNGMICALEELDIESKYIPEASKGGIHILPNDAPIGEDALKYLGLDDIVISYDLTSNRADLLSMIGMAYEARALVEREIKLPDTTFSEADDDINDYLEINVNTSNCPKYLARMVKDIEIKESPEFIKARLMASGIRSINNVVDISNYVMLEYGQPLHFFDYDKLGTNITVRMAENNEKAITLDKEKRILTNEDIVITNNNEVIAVAGVMGGLDTEVTNNTTQIVIESAIFKPENVRRTSKRILRSEASSRFEKGLDPNKTSEALNRACHLLEKYASGKTLKGMLSHDNIKLEEKVINLTIDKINKVLGIELTSGDIAKVFDKLQLTYQKESSSFRVSTPTRRLDLSIEEDLIEEIGRIHGYDEIKGVLPDAKIKPGKYYGNFKKRRKLRNKLLSVGLKEVISYSLINKANINKFNNNVFDNVSIINPMSEDRSVLRKSLLDSLLKIVEYNKARKLDNINIFEIGSGYYKKDNEYTEEEKLACVMTGDYLRNQIFNQQIKVDFYLIKGILEELLDYIGLDGRYYFKASSNIPGDFHPGISGEIIVDGDSIGYIGSINPTLSEELVYMFEISLDKIYTKNIEGIKFIDIPRYPAVNKDLAFILRREIEARDVVNIIKNAGGKLLELVDVFDVYSGESIGINNKSIAFSLVFRDPNKTLIDIEVNNIIETIIKQVEKEFNAKLRDK